MGMTITEKILAAHSNKDTVRPGEMVMATVDLVMCNELSAGPAIEELRKVGARRVFDPCKIVLVPDHFTPNKDIPSANLAKVTREFAREQGVVYFEVGRAGIEHIVLPELGLVVPGDLVIGADSHTCTYGALAAFATGVGATDAAAAIALGETWLKVPPTIKLIYNGKLRPWVSGKDLILYAIGQLGVDGARYQALEFTGALVSELSMADRFTMANMAIEAGAKNGIFAADEKTIAYVRAAGSKPYLIYESDPDAEYARLVEFDVGGIELQVALPGSPENVRPLGQVGNIPIDQVVIGCCTNGRLEDLRIAADILKDRHVHPSVRVIIIPGSQNVYLQALRAGLIEAFVESGCAVSTPTCGPCFGGHMGVLAEGERCVATTNRNFVGRMGHSKSEVYLAGPAVAAASAVAGRIVGPDDL